MFVSRDFARELAIRRTILQNNRFAQDRTVPESHVGSSHELDLISNENSPEKGVLENQDEEDPFAASDENNEEYDPNIEEDNNSDTSEDTEAGEVDLSHQHSSLTRLIQQCLPISIQKYNDLKKLCTNEVIPSEFHQWYLSLPMSTTVKNRNAEPSVDSESEED
ncbi:unnamed protein product [Psylliodes chrysocephalus]|uniref:Uncharacterized protein n=1 Tax=Psylliodes chrysocephalus TaxID=3402493 RepID=A0A9P0D2S1_9CUCU|nr:unnamed protein product [Psylliodes chrysocephala]